MSDEFDENDNAPEVDDTESTETDDSAQECSDDTATESSEPLEEQNENDSDDSQNDNEDTTDMDTLDYENTEDESQNDNEDTSDMGILDSENPEDESQLSPTELLERGERERDAAQKAAEEWADNGGANRWSDGSIRQGHEDDTYYRTTNEVQALEDEIRKNQLEKQNSETSVETEETPDDNNTDYDESPNIEDETEKNQDFMEQEESNDPATEVYNDRADFSNNNNNNSFMEQGEAPDPSQTQEIGDTSAEDEEYDKLKEQYKDANREMREAENDMDWAKSKDEKDYWFKRSQEHWARKDDAEKKMTSYEQKNKK